MKVLEREIRCKRCKRLLMKGEVWAIEIKCPKCGFIQHFHAQRGDTITKHYIVIPAQAGIQGKADK